MSFNFAIVLILAVALIVSAIDPNELRALQALYNTAGGPGWVRKGNWLSAHDPCGDPGNNTANTTWENVVCADNHVIGLQMASNNMAGAFPANFYNAFMITHIINFQNNPSLGGNIPTIPITVEQLYLGQTGLQGSIPNLFSSYYMLQFVGLNGIKQGGTISETIKSYSALVSLDLSNCGLSGQIPDVFQNIPIQYLLLSNNNLGGTLPASLFQPSLVKLFVDGNQIQGDLPTTMTRASNLQYLYLGNNQFGGSIPDTWCTAFTNLQELDLHQNGYTNFPECFGKTQHSLLTIDVSSNSIAGSIPETLCGAAQLQQIQVQNNPGLTGTIPDCITRLPFLTNFVCEVTQVSGTIPSGFFRSDSSIQVLIIGNSGFFGPIPDLIDQPKNLRVLVLNGNPLDDDSKYNGTFPASVSRAYNLTTVSFQYTSLTGKVSDLSALRKLDTVLFSTNPTLSGTFPKELFLNAWKNYTYSTSRTLELENCAFSGSIPEEIALGKNLTQMTLDGNQFSGFLPLLFNQSWPWLDKVKENYFKRTVNLLYPIPDWAMEMTDDFEGAQLSVSTTTPAILPINVPTNITVSGDSFIDFNLLFCGLCASTLQSCGNLSAYTLFPILFIDVNTLSCVVKADSVDTYHFNILYYGTAYGVKDARYNVDGNGPTTVMIYDPHPVIISVYPPTIRDQGCVKLLIRGGPFSQTPSLVCAVGRTAGIATFINRTAIQCEVPYISTGTFYPVGSLPVFVSHDKFASNSTGNGAVQVEQTCRGLAQCTAFHEDPYGGCSTGSLCVCSSHGTCNFTSGHVLNCSCDYGFTGGVCQECTTLRYGDSCDMCPNCVHGKCDQGRSGSGTCKCDSLRYIGSLCNVDAILIAGPVGFVVLVGGIGLYIRHRRKKGDGLCEKGNIQYGSVGE